MLVSTAGSVIRQSLVPMLAAYLLIMVALGLGLLRLQRRGPAPAPRAGQARGRLALIRHAAATAVGGYLLLLAVDFGYYYAVARVSGNFLVSAITGPALLIGLCIPVFAAASWLTVRRGRAAAGASRAGPTDTGSPRNGPNQAGPSRTDPPQTGPS